MPNYNLNNNLPFSQRVIEGPMTMFAALVGTIVFDKSASTLYELKITPEPDNGTSIITSLSGGNFKWVGIAGQYNYYGGGSGGGMLKLSTAQRLAIPTPTDLEVFDTDLYRRFIWLGDNNGWVEK